MVGHDMKMKTYGINIRECTSTTKKKPELFAKYSLQQGWNAMISIRHPSKAYLNVYKEFLGL